MGIPRGPFQESGMTEGSPKHGVGGAEKDHHSRSAAACENIVIYERESRKRG